MERPSQFQMCTVLIIETKNNSSMESAPKAIQPELSEILALSSKSAVARASFHDIIKMHVHVFCSSFTAACVAALQGPPPQ
jgi:hypothetical protein